LVENKKIEMRAPEYNDWKTDSDLLSYVCTQLSLTSVSSSPLNGYQNTFEVKDQIKTYPDKTVKYFKYGTGNSIYNEGIMLVVYIYDTNNEQVDIKEISLKGEDYNNWLSDDAFVTNYICTQLNFTLV